MSSVNYSSMVQNLKEAPDYEYKYDAPKRGANVIRSPKILNPTNNQTYITNNNDCMRFRFANDSPIDFRKAFLLIDVAIAATGGTYKRLTYGSWSWIDKLRYHASNDTVEDKQYYNKMYSALFTLLADPGYLDSIGGEVLGTMSQADRNTAGATTTRYVVPLYCGPMQLGVLPLHSFKNIYHELELYLAPADTFVETDGTNPIVTISNIELHYETVTSWDMSYERSLTNLVERGDFEVWFSSWITFQNNVLNQSQDLVIAQRYESVNAIISYFQLLNNLTNTTVSDKFITFDKNAILTYQFKMNSRLWPEEEIDCQGKALHAYLYYLRYAGDWTVDGLAYNKKPNINMSSFNDSDFFMVGDFRNTRCDHGAFPPVLNNISTETNAMDIILKLRLSAVPPNQLGIYHLTNYNCIVKFLPSGKAIVRQ